MTPLRCAFLFGPISTGSRPLDFQTMETNKRGMTGTDNSFCGYAAAMAKRGHEVHVYAEGVEQQTWRVSDDVTVPVYPYAAREGITSYIDAVCSWNDVAGLADAPRTAVRLLDMQVNDFSYLSHSGLLENVDQFVAPSQALIDHLRSFEDVGPWAVLPNGCNPDAYDLGAKVPGRCIYASSPDRGLHIALTKWPKIKAAVPHATLEIFYHSLPAYLEILAQECHTVERREHRRRAQLIANGLAKRDALGITVVGSVSRKEMAAEYSQAQVYAYPCETVKGFANGWGSEGFGVAVLEGCASGAVPVITDCDAFGEVYAGACPMITRGDDWTDEWAATVVEMLTDEHARNAWIENGRHFAKQHAWPVLAERLEKILGEAIARKKVAA
jgi:glycosyltransferase involved in cell wall biosynthesis